MSSTVCKGKALYSNERGEDGKLVKMVAVSGRPSDPETATLNGIERFAMPCPSCIGMLIAYEGEDMQVVVLGMAGEMVRMTRMSSIIKMRYKSAAAGGHVEGENKEVEKKKRKTEG